MISEATFVHIAKFCRLLVSPEDGKFNLFMRLGFCYTQNMSLTSAVRH